MGADELSARLWRERRQLDYLLFLLETQMLHLQTGNWHHLKYTSAELEKVVENLRFDSLARGVEASAVVAEWNAPDQTTLPAIVTVSPAGLWQDLLEDHRRELSLLLSGLDEAIKTNTSLLLGPAPSDPDANPQYPAADELAHMVRESNAQRALAAVQAASLPALREFLGL